MARESVELFKEQLRAKERELKKRDSDQAKQEAKIRHILEISQKKIETLKTEVAEKDVAIQEASEMAASMQFRQHSVSAPSSIESPSLDFSEPPKEVIKTVVETKEVMVKDPKLVKALNQLRNKNQELSDQIAAEQKGKDQLFKERAVLTKEIQRLRKEPNKMDLLKDKVAQIEERSKRAQERYEGLLNEKNELIKSYEGTLFQAGGGKGDVKKPSEIIKDLKQDLSQLEREKSSLESDLLNEKKRFDSKLSEELHKMEDEWGKRVKHLQGARQKMAKLADQIMDEAGGDNWLTTYADMVTLLLTFFILYYSIAAMNMQQFKEAILGEESASIGLLELLNSTEIKESIQNLTGIKSNDIVADINEATDLDVDTSQSKIVVRVPGLSLFLPASAELQKEGRPILDEVIRVVNKHENYKVHIQGHTDDTPIFTERFPTNWELSAARATAVLRYFVDKGVDPTKLTATGYADTFPLARNDTEPGRAKNRRVEFVLEKEKK